MPALSSHPEDWGKRLDSTTSGWVVNFSRGTDQDSSQTLTQPEAAALHIITCQAHSPLRNNILTLPKWSVPPHTILNPDPSQVSCSEVLSFRNFMHIWKRS